MKYNKIISISLLILLLGSVLFIFNSAVNDNNQLVSSSSSSEYMQNYNVYALEVPSPVDFAGESAPLNRWYVKEALDRELLVNTYWQSQTLLLIKRSARFIPLIEKILREEGMPDDIKYIAIIESGLIPTIVSPAGAAGLWQFMKSTGREYGLEVNSEVDERYHIEKATRAACDYLKKGKADLGSWTLAAAAYNAGFAGISRQMKRQNASNYYDLRLNPETGRYIYRILALKTILENPGKYGFKFHPNDLYQPIPTKRIVVDSEIEDLAIWAKRNGINYPILKEFNPWLRQSYLKNKNKKTYYFEVPADGWADFDYSTYNN
ncbi:transglycosylase-like protein with SLT domain [Balneicella halophila]|uniref:Transglycosylase-like protein with SLT domain n=1 Tax=Balneicella halophila TaxID=1537566 RepID=A0A7L4UMJ7_BALHA|nr:lytic transglycosylase domain-containing protein [Balneicella halophila]PVX49844.1 transglycosylase-like protein with SLT domain [Balneicella halophila]